MKLHIKTILLPLFLLSLVSCSNSNNGTGKGAREAYSDLSSFTDDNIEFNFTSISETDFSETYHIGFTLELTNTNTKAKSFKISQPKMVRESNKAEYSVGGYYFSEYTLECDIKTYIGFNSTIPTSIEEDNYTFYFSYNSKKVTFHLYEMPDQYRKELTITFYIDGNYAIAKSALSGKLLSDYAWLSNDFVYGCENLFFDENYQSKIPTDYRLTESIYVYGQKSSVLNYRLDSGTSTYCHVTGFNYVPQNGAIIIPKSYSGYSTFSITNGAFYLTDCRGIKTVYIPKTVYISASNFSSCPDLLTVYFEGTEAEWETKNSARYPSRTKIVFNTYYNQ